MSTFAIICYSLFFTAFAGLLISYHRDKQTSRIPYVLLIILLVFFSCIRYEVGVDYISYEVGYDKTYSMMLNHMEPVWKFVRDIMQHFNVNFAFWFILTSCMVVIPMVIFYKRHSVHFVVAVLTFVCCYMLYFETFNIVRQSVAIAISLWAWPAFREKKYVRCLLLLLIAFCFHRSVLVMIALLPFCYCRIPRVFYWVMLPVSLLFLPYVIVEGVRMMGPLVRLIIPSYDFYLHKALDQSKIIWGLTSMSRFLFSLYFLFRQKDILKKDPSLRPYFNAFFIAMILNNACDARFPEMKRFMYNLIFLLPLLTAGIYKVGERIDRFVVFLFIVAEFALTIRAFTSATDRANYQIFIKDKYAPMDYRYFPSNLHVEAWQEIPKSPSACSIASLTRL